MERYHAQPLGGREVDNLRQARQTSSPFGYCIRRPPGHSRMSGRKKSAMLTGAGYRLSQGVITLHPFGMG